MLASHPKRTSGQTVTKVSFAPYCRRYRASALKLEADVRSRRIAKYLSEWL